MSERPSERTIEVSARLLIDQPIEDLYDFVSNPERRVMWPPGTIAVDLVGGEPGVVGAMWRRIVRQGSEEVPYRLALVEALPDQVLTYRSESEGFTNPSIRRYEFSAEAENQTWLTLRVQDEAHGTRRLLSPMHRWFAGRAARRHLDQIRFAQESDQSD
ncbi:MAG TPA: hypothetical protein QGF05_12975 [Dehalococcoidia bacterium]|nr:hypothetical protein [Dehalococcoidia bacterium]